MVEAVAVIRLYGIPLSHPVLGIREMLVFKRLAYRYVELLAGCHPPMLWALGFRGQTASLCQTRSGGERRSFSLSHDG